MNRYDIALQKPPKATRDLQVPSSGSLSGDSSETIVSSAIKMIELSIQYVLGLYDGVRHTMSSDSYKRELCTIKVALPRRSGNTTIAVSLLRKIPESVLLVNNRDIGENIIRNFYLTDMASRIKIIDFNLRGTRFDYTIVDGASYMEQAKIDYMYSALDGIFILLG
jgi:hypothetical protein